MMLKSGSSNTSQDGSNVFREAFKNLHGRKRNPHGEYKQGRVKKYGNRSVLMNTGHFPFVDARRLVKRLE